MRFTTTIDVGSQRFLMDSWIKYLPIYQFFFNTSSPTEICIDYHFHPSPQQHVDGLLTLYLTLNFHQNSIIKQQSMMKITIQALSYYRWESEQNRSVMTMGAI